MATFHTMPQTTALLWLISADTNLRKFTLVLDNHSILCLTQLLRKEKLCLCVKLENNKNQIFHIKINFVSFRIPIYERPDIYLSFSQ